MKRIIIIVVFFLVVLLQFSFRYFNTQDTSVDLSIDSLRKVYSLPIEQWPKPHLDSGVIFKELGVLPTPPFNENTDSVKHVVKLGKLLFFDPRLSSSNQISCSSCHSPDLNWTDGREVPKGHDHLVGTRNVPTVQNIWASNKFFWDGRASNLEEQASFPIETKIEMHQDLSKLPKKLGKIKGYQPLFIAAFGDKEVSKERIAKALAMYQKTLVSRKSDFDYFLAGNSKRLTDEQVLGLHLFRTKAKCINCHNGPMFTNEEFHNLGLTYYGRDKYEDFGLYNITSNTDDMGKFKTPSLRDVMRTGPWFHNGLFGNIDGVINMYNAGMPQPKPKENQMKDPLFPKTDKLLKPLGLTVDEKKALIAFLHAITAEPWKIRQPELPK